MAENIPQELLAIMIEHEFLKDLHREQKDLTEHFKELYDTLKEAYGQLYEEWKSIAKLNLALLKKLENKKRISRFD